MIRPLFDQNILFSVNKTKCITVSALPVLAVQNGTCNDFPLHIRECIKT